MGVAAADYSAAALGTKKGRRMFIRMSVRLVLLSVFCAAAMMLAIAGGPSVETGRAAASNETAAGQSNVPAVEYQSLLNVRYYEADAGFLVDGLQLLFPPRGGQKLAFVITSRSGEEVARVALRVEAPIRTFETFGRLLSTGGPGVIRLGRSGDFLMAVKVGDQTVTSLPFSIKEEKSQDPYNPKKRFLREGPWREMAYFSSPLDDPSTPIKFNWWMSLRELAPGAKNPLCTVHLMHAGQEIAATTGPVVPMLDDWQFYKKEMRMSKSLGGQFLTLASLTRKDGDLTIVLKANGQPVKSYRAQIRGGQLQRLARNQLEFEPHTDFISSRLIDLSADGGCEYCMLDLFWLKTPDR
jgi:hypothetical protein